MRTLAGTLPVLLTLAVAVSPIRGVSVRSWEPATAEEFARGSFEGIAIDEDGGLRLGPVFESLWGPESGVVWDVSVDARGQGLFAALSGPARVLRVGQDRQSRVWFEDTDRVLATAVAADRRGVFFGLSPEGRVLHAGAPGEKVEVLDAGAEFVWALSTDPRGDLWVGTGSPGKLMRLGSDGQAEVVFESGDDPVRSLAVHPEGGVVAGTGDRGRVIRFAPDGEPFVLHDADEDEIVSLAVLDDGTVFALAAGAGAGGRRPGPAPTGPAPVGDRVTVRAPAPEESDPEQQAEEASPKGTGPQPRRSTAPAAGAGGALYRIDPDGGVRRIWHADHGVPYAVAIRGERLLVATGGEGRVYELTADGRETAVLRFPSDEVVALATAANGDVFVGGAKDARIARVVAGPASSGWFESEPLDAGVTARWGGVQWDASVPPGASLTLELRSGNSDNPDATGSEWAAPQPADPAGNAMVAAPVARRLQARVRMEASPEHRSPVLRRISVFYLPDNRPPEIERLEVEPVGVAWTSMPIVAGSQQGPLATDDPVALRSADSLQPKSRPVRVVKGYEVGARTFSWSASDPDGDTLTYKLEIRREGEQGWFPLARDIEESFHSWDARAMPDGLYRVRLSADDARDNPNGRHRLSTRTSAPFRIDNTPPTLEGLVVERDGVDLRVRFVARDPGGRVDTVEYSLEGSDWMPLDPLDGVADSAVERYELRLPAAGRTEERRHLMLRVTDSAGNLGGEMRRLPQ